MRSHYRSNFWKPGGGYQQIQKLNTKHYLLTRMAADFKAASCTKLSEIGDSLLSRRVMREKMFWSISPRDTEQMEANFYREGYFKKAHMQRAHYNAYKTF